MTARRKDAASPHDATVSAVGGAMGWSVITRVLQSVLALVGSIIVVRSLGPDRYGMLTVLRTSLAFVSAACGLGLGQAVLRYFPTARARGDRTLALRLVRWTLVPQFVVWAVALFLAWGLGGWIASISFATMSTFFLLGVALLITELALGAGTNLATAFYDSRILSIVTLGGALTYLGFTVAILARGGGVAGVLWATGLSNLIMAVVLAVRLWPRVAALPAAATPSTDGKDISSASVLRYSLPFAAITIMNLITWRQSETLILAHYRTMRESGYFDLAYRIPQMLLEFVPGAIWPLLMAGFSEIYTRDKEKLSRAISVYYKLLFLLVAPISIVGAALGDRAIVAFYGEEMLPAGPLCQAFFVIFSLAFLSTPLSMAFYVLERPWYSFGLYVFNSIINVGLDLILIPRFGLVGAIIPVALVIFISPFTNYYLLRRLGVRPPIPWGFLARVYLAAIPCALLFPARYFIVGKLPVALVALGAGILYIAGLRLFRVLGDEEGALLRRSGLPMASRLGRLLGLKDS